MFSSSLRHITGSECSGTSLTMSLSPRNFKLLLCLSVQPVGGSMKRRILHTLIFALLLATLAAAQDLASFEKKVTVKKLANGLTVIICERPEAPVFSFFTQVDAGSAQDPRGETGLAHMFEHMA